jgi:hypothetical protein
MAIIDKFVLNVHIFKHKILHEAFINSAMK